MYTWSEFIQMLFASIHSLSPSGVGRLLWRSRRPTKMIDWLALKPRSQGCVLSLERMDHMKAKQLCLLPLLLWGAIFMFSGCAEPSVGDEARARPNIILIMSDDMGFSDLGCYGGEVRTPNLDHLAEHGVRLTQFYNTARCCPTRASLLTGLYPHQAGMGWMTAIDSKLPAYQGDLSHSSVTLAEVARSAGYSTFMAGKWHVSRNEKDDGPKDNWPLQRGFDRFFGTIMGAGSYFDPATLCRGNALVSPFATPSDSSEPFYYTDAITDAAIQFVEQRQQERPFFMYVAYTAAHWPMQARDDKILKYQGMYDAGWEAVRERRFDRMKAMGLLSAEAELSPLDVHPWGDEKHQDVEAGRMEVYAAMIDEMDQGIGRIVGALAAQKVLDNTVILFLQDNGGCAEEIGSLGETRPWADDVADLEVLGPQSIQTEMIPQVTRDGLPIMRGEGVRGGPDSTYVSYGKVWANASNTPFREYKHWVHEGGISTPLIIYYPDGVRNEGRFSSFTGHVIDIMPTIVELTGAEYPEEFDGHEIQPMEGRSLVPLFRDNMPERETPICWEHEMNRAVRLGKWKLVSKGELLNGDYGTWKNYKQGPWELYDIEKDRSELHDLSEEYPERVREMAAIWDDYAARVHVFPAPWKPVEVTK